MPASEARIKANQANALKSRGPVTVEGKEKSRRNALKHGLTGAGVVLAEADAAEVERRTAAFKEELLPIGEVEMALVRRAALNSVRMERAADQQTAALSERVRRVEAEFVAPERVSSEEADRLKAEAARRAMFDPSKEATLARKYEAAAERGFFRALKELREMDKSARAEAGADAALQAQAMMGSFLRMQEEGRELDARFDAMEAELGPPPLIPPSRSPYPAPSLPGFDLPITIGKRP
jgi:hypothetical protein